MLKFISKIRNATKTYNGRLQARSLSFETQRFLSRSESVVARFVSLSTSKQKEKKTSKVFGLKIKKRRFRERD
jgi:hypothetical protein